MEKEKKNEKKKYSRRDSMKVKQDFKGLIEDKFTKINNLVFIDELNIIESF
jgi:hypothetical protein